MLYNIIVLKSFIFFCIILTFNSKSKNKKINENENKQSPLS